MPWSLWIIALFQDEPANFEKSLAGFWALSVDSLVLHPKLFHPWHCRMDKPGIGSSEPSQFCHEKCVAWALEAAENRPAFAACYRNQNTNRTQAGCSQQDEQHKMCSQDAPFTWRPSICVAHCRSLWFLNLSIVTKILRRSCQWQEAQPF